MVFRDDANATEGPEPGGGGHLWMAGFPEDQGECDTRGGIAIKNVVMRQEHRPGEKTFVDWAGPTVPIH